jgi:hypothetical protein
MSDSNETPDPKSWLDKVAGQATKMVNLEIKTYIGDMTYVEADKKASFTNNANVEGIHSTINLLQGDIRTEMSKNFHDNYQDLLKFHQTREKNGQEIIKNNIALVKELVETITDFMSEGNGDS